MQVPILLDTDRYEKIGACVCSLVLVGDLGQTHNSSATLDHMAESLSDIYGHNAAPHLLYTADYSYADDYQSNGTETVRRAFDCLSPLPGDTTSKLPCILLVHACVCAESKMMNAAAAQPVADRQPS